MPRVGASLRELPWPSSDKKGPEKFLQDARSRSLWVTKLHAGEATSDDLRTEFSAFLRGLPDSCADRFGQRTLNSPEGRARAIAGLVSKHSGELVELDHLAMRWQLRKVAPGSAGARLPMNKFT